MEKKGEAAHGVKFQKRKEISQRLRRSKDKTNKVDETQKRTGNSS